MPPARGVAERSESVLGIAILKDRNDLELHVDRLNWAFLGDARNSA
jgi:hypothetical protein